MNYLWALVTALLLVCIHEAGAFEIREVSLEYQRFHPSALFPEMPGHIAKEGLALNLNTNLFGHIPWVGTPVWDNKIHSLSDPGQYRMVGWQFFVGLRGRYLDFGYLHHSQHLLDDHRTDIKYPVNDSLFLKVYLLRADPGE